MLSLEGKMIKIYFFSFKKFNFLIITFKESIWLKLKNKQLLLAFTSITNNRDYYEVVGYQFLKTLKAHWKENNF